MTFGLRNRAALIAAVVLLAAIGALIAASAHYFGSALANAQIAPSVIESASAGMMRTLLATGALVALAGLLLLFAALARYVNRPLNEIVSAIERIRTGERADSLPAQHAGGTELAIIVDAFNDLLGRAAMLERELVAAGQAAEKANGTGSDFLSMMSHELRTPMHAVLGMAELLSYTTLSERQSRYVESINSAGASLLRVLDEILTFTRIEKGELSILHRPFALPRLVEETVALFHEGARSKGLTLEVQVDPAVPGFVTGDAGRTRQILLSLLGNAVKFTHHGGVSLHVVRGSGDRIRFSITDTGIGIDPAFQKQLYRAFSQQDTGYTRRYGGLGLGLAIAKRLCDAMQGSIDMESVAGKGTTFWFELPLPAVPAAAHGQQAPAGLRDAQAAPLSPPPVAPAPGKLRVLVVEDNRLNQELVVGYLADSEYQVTLANDGREGVEKFEHERFDVVLMDWQMPEMDGLEATRRIREFERNRGLRRTPIIAITAHAAASDREACIAAGMDDYLVKPYSFDALLRALRRWAPRA